MPDQDEINVDFIEGASEESEDNENKDNVTDDDDKSGEDTENEDLSNAEDDDSESEEIEAKKPTKTQKRINQLTKKMRDLERDNIYLRGRLTERDKVASSSEKADDTPAELSRDDFDSDDAYFKALIKQNLEIPRKEREDETKKQEKEQENRDRETIQAQFDNGRKKYKDFDDVALADDHKVTQDMFDAAKGEHLEDILYVLGKNPAASDRIASLPTAQQIKEIGKIEARIEKVKGKKPKQNTPEEEPVPVLKGGSKPSSVTPKDVSQMSFRERQAHWEKEREANLKREHGLA